MRTRARCILTALRRGATLGLDMRHRAVHTAAPPDRGVKGAALILGASVVIGSAVGLGVEVARDTLVLHPSARFSDLSAAVAAHDGVTLERLDVDGHHMEVYMKDVGREGSDASAPVVLFAVDSLSLMAHEAAGLALKGVRSITYEVKLSAGVRPPHSASPPHNVTPRPLQAGTGGGAVDAGEEGSSDASDAGTQTQAKLLAHVLQRAGVTSPVVVVSGGLDWPGALSFCAHNAAHIVGLVLLDPLLPCLPSRCSLCDTATETVPDTATETECETVHPGGVSAVAGGTARAEGTRGGTGEADASTHTSVCTCDAHSHGGTGEDSSVGDNGEATIDADAAALGLAVLRDIHASTVDFAPAGAARPRPTSSLNTTASSGSSGASPCFADAASVLAAEQETTDDPLALKTWDPLHMLEHALTGHTHHHMFCGTDHKYVKQYVKHGAPLSFHAGVAWGTNATTSDGSSASTTSTASGMAHPPAELRAIGSASSTSRSVDSAAGTHDTDSHGARSPRQQEQQHDHDGHSHSGGSGGGSVDTMDACTVHVERLYRDRLASIAHTPSLQHMLPTFTQSFAPSYARGVELTLPFLHSTLKLGGDARLQYLDGKLAGLNGECADVARFGAWVHTARALLPHFPVHIRITTPSLARGSAGGSSGSDSGGESTHYLLEPRWDSKRAAFSPPTPVETEVRIALEVDARRALAVWRAILPGRCAAMPPAPASSHEEIYVPETGAVVATLTRLAGR